MEHWNLGKQTSSLQEIRKRNKARNRGKDEEKHETRKKYWKEKRNGGSSTKEARIEKE